MLPEFSQIVRCPECNSFIWLEEAEIAGEFDWFNRKDDKKPPQEWEKSQSALDPKTKDFAIALEEGQGSNKEKERYLRMQLWWNLNDPVRTGERSAILPPDHEELFSANLKKLSSFLNHLDPEDRIMAAEIARECGAFDECKSLLADIPGQYESVCKLIRNFADEGNRVVQKINI